MSEATEAVFRAGGSFGEMVEVGALKRAAQNAWLERNTFRCPHLHARITPNQCADMRSRPEGAGWTQKGVPLWRPPACAACEEWEKFQAAGGCRGGENDEENEMGSKRKACAACGREMNICALGLCASCYKYAQAGRVAQSGDGVWTWTDGGPADYWVQAGLPVACADGADARDDGESGLDVSWSEGEDLDTGVPEKVLEVRGGSQPCGCSSTPEGVCGAQGQDGPHPTPGPGEEPEFIGMDKAGGEDRAVGALVERGEDGGLRVVRVGGLTLRRFVPGVRKAPLARVIGKAARLGLRLTADAVEMFGVEERRFVELFRDDRADAIGIRFVEESGRGTMTVTLDGRSKGRRRPMGLVSCHIFLTEGGFESGAEYQLEEVEGGFVVGRRRREVREEAA